MVVPLGMRIIILLTCIIFHPIFVIIFCSRWLSNCQCIPNEDSKDNVRGYIRTGAPNPFEYRSRKRKRSHLDQWCLWIRNFIGYLVVSSLSSQPSSLWPSNCLVPMCSYGSYRINTSTLLILSNRWGKILRLSLGRWVPRRWVGDQSMKYW